LDAHSTELPELLPKGRDRKHDRLLEVEALSSSNAIRRNAQLGHLHTRSVFSSPKAFSPKINQLMSDAPNVLLCQRLRIRRGPIADRSTAVSPLEPPPASHPSSLEIVPITAGSYSTVQCGSFAETYPSLCPLSGHKGPLSFSSSFGAVSKIIFFHILENFISDIHNFLFPKNRFDGFRSIQTKTTSTTH
jgi:hypothetical protein